MHQAQSLSPVQPMLSRDVPDGPWQEIATDCLTNKGKEYLLVCNLFRKYPFLYKVTIKSAQSLSVCLQEVISQYRLPCVLDTDNGPPFASDKLAQFLQHHHIDNITPFSYFSRSNRFIKCQVQTIKTALSTTEESFKSQEDLLLDL